MRFDYLQEGIRDKIEEYDKRRDDISDLELMYDKKYNAFAYLSLIIISIDFNLLYLKRLMNFLKQKKKRNLLKINMIV